MIIPVGEHVEAEFFGSVRQIMTVVNVKYFMGFGAAGFGSNAVYPVVGLSGSFLIRQYVPVKILHEGILFFDMRIMHGVGVGDENGSVLRRQLPQKLDHGAVGCKDIVPYPFELPKRETKSERTFDPSIELKRCDLTAIVKNLYAGLNKIVLDVLCGNLRVFRETFKSRVKVKKQQNFSQVK